MKPNKELNKHCRLCENRVFNLNEGTKCGLTNQYPKFNHRCKDIKFGSILSREIKEFTVELHQLKQKQFKVNIKFYISLVAVGLVGIFCLYIFISMVGIYEEHSFQGGRALQIPLYILGVSATAFFKGIYPYTKYIKI
ncbi:hypothetical protein MY04_0226 [Flammeovirga sp. MY04]|uniref:hypothetical protein n=1 Tax=Flammeovirga sp. MY04 TaxID=1191459 RepID=UPI0008062697|nr:hypothetical protein [Flammeovirga sp. MY04]ANQ47608.1 hypothetical protein MY04_0226 [Flammeovirga sp. MY04]